MVMVPLARSAEEMQELVESVVDPIAEAGGFQQSGPQFSIFSEPEAATEQESSVGEESLATPASDPAGYGKDHSHPKIIPVPDQEGLGMCEVCGAAEAELDEFTCDEYKAKVESGRKERESHSELLGNLPPKTMEIDDNDPAPESTKEILRDMAGLPLGDSSDRLASAEREYREACEECSRIDREIKSLKEDRKLARETADEAYDRLLEARAKAGQPGNAGSDIDDSDHSDSFPLANGGAADAASDEQPSESLSEPLDGSTRPLDPNWWRNATISEIDLDEIDGLGPKKKAKLIDEVPTVGDLEDMRQLAATSFPPQKFSERLPKGIGKGSADEIENRLIAWLSKNRDAAEFQERPKPPADEIHPEDVLVSGVGVSTPVGTLATSGGKPLEPISEADSEALQVITRARELEAMNPRPEPQFMAIFQDGQREARNGEPVASCNWTASDKQDSWLLGWLSIESLSEGANSNERDDDAA